MRNDPTQPIPTDTDAVASGTFHDLQLQSSTSPSIEHRFSINGPNFVQHIEAIMSNRELSYAKRFLQIEFLWEMHGDIFNNHEVVTALQAATQCAEIMEGVKSGKICAAIFEEVRVRAHLLSPPDVTAALYAIRHLSLPVEDSIFALLAKNLDRNMGHFSFEEISISAYSLSRAGYHNPHLAQHIEEIFTSAKSDDLSHNALTGMLHYLTWSKHMDGAAGSYILELIEKKVDHFEPHNLSTTLWNLSLRRGASQSLIEALGKRVSEKLSEFHTLSPLSYILQGLITNLYGDKERSQQIFRRAMELIETGRSGDLLRVFCSIHAEDLEQRQFGRELAGRLIGSTDQFGPYDHLKILTTLGDLGLYEHSLVKEVSKQIGLAAHTYKPRVAALALGALARVHHFEPIITKSLVSIFIKDAESVGTSDIAYMTFGLAELRYEDKQLASKISQILLTRNDLYQADALPRALLGLAVIDPTEAKSFSSKLTLTDHYINQLTSYRHKLLYRGLILCDGIVSSALEQAVKSPMHNPLAAEPKPSSFEEEVGKVLLRLGVPFMQQVYDHGYRSDFVIQERDRKIILECDGVYYHHLNGNGKAPQTGETFARDQILRKLGRELVVLKCTDWEIARGKVGAQRSTEDRERAEEDFLRRLLNLDISAK